MSRYGMILMAVISLSAGAVMAQWGPDGITVAGGSNNQFQQVITSGLDDTTFLAWEDASGAYSRIFVQKISPDGQPMWTSVGVAVTNDTLTQQNPICTSAASVALEQLITSRHIP